MEWPVRLKFSDFFGMPPHIEKLVKGFQDGDWWHAYLFIGARGTGKRSIAELSSRIVHCTGDEKPCGVCQMCCLMQASSNPDHIVVRPEKSIGIERIRELIAKIRQKPFEGGAYTVVIEGADKMTVQAQNALLKTLESPVGDCVFFLLTDAESALLPTIRSRALPVRFPGISHEQMLKALEARGMDSERARALIPGAHGSVGRALELDGDEQYQVVRGEVRRALARIRTELDVIDALEPLTADAAQVGAILECLEDEAREQLRARHASYECAIDPALLLLGVSRARRSLASNVSLQSALEKMFFHCLI